METIKILQESVNQVEKSVNAISRPPGETSESEVLPSMLNYLIPVGRAAFRSKNILRG